MENEELPLPDSQPSHRSLFERIFISPDEPRPRAGWRLLLHLMLLGAIIFFIGFLGEFVIQLGLNELLASLGFVLAVTLSVYLARIFLDRRSFTSLGLKLEWRALWDILAGFGIAGSILGLTCLLEWAFGWLTFLGYTWEFLPVGQVALLSLNMLLVFIFVGWQEELVLRGYYLQNMIDGLNMPLAVFLSSAIFGILHLGNPGASWMSTLVILLAGVFLAYAYLRTRRLWLPIGLHIGWNFFQGTVFGFPVSGMDGFHLIQQSVEGPGVLTGGVFGPDAGLILLPGLVLGAALVTAYSHCFSARKAEGSQ
ncbi:MAG: CPBP family intramembrane metalloprotease [Anaerolineales bacterium]|nr:CPBP family intramembrane metalloprotease [Anaerolineales bacterium]